MRIREVFNFFFDIPGKKAERPFHFFGQDHFFGLALVQNVQTNFFETKVRKSFAVKGFEAGIVDQVAFVVVGIVVGINVGISVGFGVGIYIGVCVSMVRVLML